MNDIKKLTEVIKEKDDLATYRALQLKIAATIDGSNSGRDIAALSRQLRDVTEKIAELEALNQETDPIAEIIKERETFCAPGAIRNERRQAVYEYTKRT